MLMTQATEAQQKQNNFRSCPVFSAASLQWWRSLYRNSLLYSAAEFFMLRKNHPSHSTKRTEISFPVPFQLSLLLWWSGIRGVSWQCSITPKKLCFPGRKSIHQDWTGTSAERTCPPYSIDMNRTCSEKELEVSVFFWWNLCFSVFQCYTLG